MIPIQTCIFNLQAFGLQVPSRLIGFVVTLSPTYVIRRYNNYGFHSPTFFMSITLVGADELAKN